VETHLVDGTYELFRHFYAVPPRQLADGTEVAATVGVIGSIIGMLEGGATHIGVATDHVIESFRNDLWPGYKTGEGIDPALGSQFGLLEEGLRALGVTVWAMVEQEADDALAAAAVVAAADPRVDRVLICTPDKDLAQCVRGTRVVRLDRRKREVMDESGVVAKFGVGPASVPDWLALVGDSADGFPGLPGWGPKAATALLARYGTIEEIPASGWDVTVRSAPTLAATLVEQRNAALLFKLLATLRTDAAVGDVDAWRWTGPTDEFKAMCARLDAAELYERAEALAR
jgi:5'-3' exonuclease